MSKHRRHGGGARFRQSHAHQLRTTSAAVGRRCHIQGVQEKRAPNQSNSGSISLPSSHHPRLRVRRHSRCLTVIPTQAICWGWRLPHRCGATTSPTRPADVATSLQLRETSNALSSGTRFVAKSPAVQRYFWKKMGSSSLQRCGAHELPSSMSKVQRQSMPA